MDQLPSGQRMSNWFLISTVRSASSQSCVSILVRCAFPHIAAVHFVATGPCETHQRRRRDAALADAGNEFNLLRIRIISGRLVLVFPVAPNRMLGCATAESPRLLLLGFDNSNFKSKLCNRKFPCSALQFHFRSLLCCIHVSCFPYIYRTFFLHTNCQQYSRPPNRRRLLAGKYIDEEQGE